jgi:hypothetical protein
MKKSNYMISFQKLWENMEAAKNGDNESKASSAIRTGIGVRENFWDDFLSVINNSSGLSELLDVPVTKIASWHQKVKEELNKIKEIDKTPDASSNRKMIHTGLPEEDDNLEQGNS